MQPSVYLVNNPVLSVSASVSDTLAIVGTAATGTANEAHSISSVRQIAPIFTDGMAALASARTVSRGGKVVAARAAQSAAGTATGFASSNSHITLDSSPTPSPELPLSIKLEVVNGGEVGTVGITYRVSQDGGSTWGNTTALGTDLDAEVAHGVRFNFATGEDLLAGDLASVTTTAPAVTSTQIIAAITPLLGHASKWELCLIANPLDDASIIAVHALAESEAAAGRPRIFFYQAAVPTAGQSADSYIAARTALSTTLDTEGYGSVSAGVAPMVNPLTGSFVVAPVAMIEAAEEIINEPHIDVADIDLGALPGVTNRDFNGNQVAAYYDETFTPGLDNLGYTTLRSWNNRGGTFINRPRIFTADPQVRLVPLARVRNLGDKALVEIFEHLLSSPLAVDSKTGFLLEDTKQNLERAAMEQLAQVLLVKPYASDVLVEIENIVNLTVVGAELLVNATITPLAYIERIRIERTFGLRQAVGF